MFLETYRWYQFHHPIDKITLLTSQANHQNLKVTEVTNPILPRSFNKTKLLIIGIKTILLKSVGINFLTPKEKQLLEVVKDQDRIHFCGGGNLTSIYSNWLYYSLTILCLAHLYTKEIVLTSQTIGPFNLIDKLIASFFINRAKIIAIRGHDQNLGGLSVTLPQISNMLDAATTLPTTTDQKIPSKTKTIRIGLSIHRLVNDNFLKQLPELLSSISQSIPIEIILIPHIIVDEPNQWDLGFMEELFSKAHIPIIKPNISNILNSKPEPAYYIKDLTASVDLLISTRYHGLVFALSKNILMNKISGFLRWPRRRLINLERLI